MPAPRMTVWGIEEDGGFEVSRWSLVNGRVSGSSVIG
jgi:hypothetical protein